MKIGKGASQKKKTRQTNGGKTIAMSTYMKQFLSSSVFVMIGVCIVIFNFSKILQLLWSLDGGSGHSKISTAL
jgi:hypothetical protein